MRQDAVFPQCPQREYGDTGEVRLLLLIREKPAYQGVSGFLVEYIQEGRRRVRCLCEGFSFIGAILSPSPLLFGQYETLLAKQLSVIFFTTTTTMYLEEPDQVNLDEL